MKPKTKRTRVRKPRRYTKGKDGEWIQPIKRGYLMACCDCGLVHRMDFRIAEDRVQFRPSRARNLTAQLRKRMNVRIKYLESKGRGR